MFNLGHKYAGINGWDALKRLTKAGYNHPVIVISADKSESFKERALKAGAVGYLQKPFDDHYLLHMVTRVFDKTGDNDEKSKRAGFGRFKDVRSA